MLFPVSCKNNVSGAISFSIAKLSYTTTDLVDTIIRNENYAKTPLSRNCGIHHYCPDSLIYGYDYDYIKN